MLNGLLGQLMGVDIPRAFLYPSAMNLQTASIEQLKEVISIKEQIASLEQQLAKLTGTTSSVEVASAIAPEKRGRKKMSPAARAKIAASAKTRWARVKGVSAVAGVSAPAKKTRKKMSAEAKAKISAAAKTRWARVKGTSVAAAAPAKKAKRTMSPEGRARIVAALKKRWAAKRKK
jgi:hypothetical protein